MRLDFEPAQLRAYLVAGTQDVPGQDLRQVLQKALVAGITAFQYRDKGTSQLTASQRYELGLTLRAACAQAQVPFIVDDDVELALALKADGVHVGQTDHQIQQVLQQVAGKLFVGLSCTTLTEVRTANQLSDLAYLGSGPVFPTRSKRDAAPVIGLAGLTQLVQAASHPVVAIGGITAPQLRPIAQTGAVGSAVISLITQSSDYPATVQAMLAATM
ncbi:thiamine phosphate synthase [Lactobacillus sp. CBA3605]|uniref:thiamine phosphate synthase n=1 Tax=Lactobacillus sp. CBA3605 TaxID=2099788 RepID=UPI000CFE231C|nr:thiamine phosphate synthase [Lactobacillus sp. CBA3605]AVK61591.1 thiamine phosphate synthase [Lactobacillus sp. CBA3605]